jgi:hypothetical protein
MGVELGRISGPLLAENLLRHGAPLAFETDLLYLFVAGTGKVGINTISPGRELDVVGTTSFNNGAATGSDVRVTTSAKFTNLNFVNNRIQALSGNDIYFTPDQTTNPVIVANEIQTASLQLVNSAITSLVSNNDINFTANGTGKVTFNTTQVNVNADLHATGNITWDGNVIIGNPGQDDNVTFKAEVASDLIPDVNQAYDLGSLTKRWNTLYSTNLQTENLTLASSIINGIDLLTTPGNTIFVSTTGDDANTGLHQHSAFRTIKHALSIAQVDTEVFIYPGIYQEIFPLTVPAGVSVNGGNIRSVTIIPTSATNHLDCFLLNGETTVANLTIRHMYYDSINDTGYAFRFAPGAKVTTRSPYIQNITVLNTGTLSDSRPIIDGGLLSEIYDAILEGGDALSIYISNVDGGIARFNDTIGFSSGDAGRGALVDGSAVHVDSNEAAILFHAVTFIVPNADGVTLTNGARSEWLNSFTYFANIGIRLTQGTLGFASLGTRFGAEIRSINSANVYGNYGATADGADTLGYLIGHNFGYIGSGGNSFNDDGLTLQANEVVEINNGHIYFDSMDHKGNFRVGNILLVNQQTGQVTFDAQSINFGPSGNITLDGPGSQTIIDATKVQVGNIRIHDNNIDSLSGPVNFYAYSEITTLNTDVYVTGNVNVSNNVTVNGNVFLGDDQYDLITIYPKLTQDINPETTDTYTLGVKGLDPKVWNTAFLTTLDIDGVTQLTNNTISTLTTDTDLELISAGNGLLRVTGTDVQLDQQLTVDGTVTVNGTTSLKNTEIGTILSPKTITLTGNIGQTGNTYITGLFDNNNISVTGVGSYLQVPNINILDNVISTTTSDLDLTFTANGTGGVVFDNKLKIVDNVISNVWASPSNNTQRSILFTPNGTGSLVIDATSALTVPYSNNVARVLGVNGEIRQNSLDGEYEGFNNTGNESLTKFHSADKKTFITPELALGTNDNIIRMYVNNTIKATIDVDKMASNVLQVGNFVLSGNTINNPVTGSDTIIQPSGTGSIDANGLLFKDSSITNTLSTPIVLASTGIGYVKFTGTGAVVFPYGNTAGRRLTPELGETRYNYQLNYMEVFNGTDWIPATGTSGAAPLNSVIDIMDLWGLVLG